MNNLFLLIYRRYDIYLNLFVNTLFNNFLSVIQYSLIFLIFGISREIEIFFYSIFIIELIDKILQTGFINNLILPKYIKYLQKSKNLAYKYLSSFIFFYVLISLFILVGYYFFGFLVLNIIYQNLSDNEFYQVLFYSNLLIFLLPFKVFNSIIIVAFRALKIFGLHEISSSLSRLIIIFLLIFYSDLGVFILFFGIFLTVLIRFLILIFMVYLKKIKIGVYLKKLNFSKFYKKNYKIMITTFANGSSLMIRRSIIISMFTFFSPGIFAVFKYFELVFEIINVLSVKIINNIFLVKLSFQNKYNSYKNITTNRILYLSFFFIFISIFLFSFNDTILQILNKYSDKIISQNIFNNFIYYFSIVALVESSRTLLTSENIYRNNYYLHMLLHNFNGLFFASISYFIARENGINFFLILYLVHYLFNLTLSILINLKYRTNNAYKYVHIKSTSAYLTLFVLFFVFNILFDQESFFSELLFFVLCAIILSFSFLALRMKFIENNGY